jgi:hypothetical protein
MSVIKKLAYFILFLPIISWAQQRIVTGVVTDAKTGAAIPYVSVQLLHRTIGTASDSLGRFSIATSEEIDSISFNLYGYAPTSINVVFPKASFRIQVAVQLTKLVAEINSVQVVPPDEFPSTILHKKIIAHKALNNKTNLSAYEYEVYNKYQIDLNNVGKSLTKKKLFQSLDFVMNYLDTQSMSKSHLPMLLSESISSFYYKTNPTLKKEIVQATRIAGIENVQLNQFLGDMYLDFNIYDNNIILFNRTIISPVSDYARTYYRFYLEDSAFIDNHWCLKLRFKPKKQGDLTLVGEMWVHDTTFAVKEIKATLSPDANINYVQGLYFEQKFQYADNHWMLSNEKMIVDATFAQSLKTIGIYVQRSSSRNNFKINTPHEDNFYKTKNTVDFQDSAAVRSNEYWQQHRHSPLQRKEENIDKMLDSLNKTPAFRLAKKSIYLFSTGYYPIKKIDVGEIYSVASYNVVEQARLALSLRTNNNFSKRLEFKVKGAYGFGDTRLKYGASIRYNITPKKRGILSLYYNYDIEQIGQSSNVNSVGSTFGTLIRTGPQDKLTFVRKVGFNLEKDVGKDLIVTSGFEAKEYVPLGIANYIQLNPITQGNDIIRRIQTSEFTAKIRWAKNEDFIAGAMDRTAVRSIYPILSFQAIIGIKDLLGGDYNYQKVEFGYEHNHSMGAFGRLKYGANAGIIFGNAAYPFLKVHEGNQSFWLYSAAFNQMNYFEFISDKYVSTYIENHWEGLLFDRIPLVKRLKLRLVTTGKMVYGSLSDRHNQEMILPSFRKDFGKIPYVEVSVGVENIFKIARVDFFWRLTHLDPGASPFGVRVRWAFNF